MGKKRWRQRRRGQRHVRSSSCRWRWQQTHWVDSRTPARLSSQYCTQHIGILGVVSFIISPLDEGFIFCNCPLRINFFTGLVLVQEIADLPHPLPIKDKHERLLVSYGRNEVAGRYCSQAEDWNLIMLTRGWIVWQDRWHRLRHSAQAGPFFVEEKQKLKGLHMILNQILSCWLSPCMEWAGQGLVMCLSPVRLSCYSDNWGSGVSCVWLHKDAKKINTNQFLGEEMNKEKKTRLALSAIVTFSPYYFPLELTSEKDRRCEGHFTSTDG